MSGTSSIEHKMDEAVLDEVNKRTTMIDTIMKRKIKLIGHYLRHN